MRADRERERKERESKGSQDKENERALYVQTCILVGVMCLLCAGMILFEIFWTQPVVIYENPQSATPSVENSPLPSASSEADSSASVSEQGQKINLNTASAQELESLPGIGEVKAQAIITYREQEGPFQTIEQVMEVKGIGEKTFESIRDWITVE